MTADEITALSARALSQAIHARRVSAREVMQATLARIATLNPTLNAVVSLRDTDALLAEADTLDAELAAGHSRGWMHGMPQAIKDLAMTAGLTTTMGSPVFARQVPAEDSIHVARMRSAGAIVIGKTNVPEFGLGSHTTNPLFGPTLNPYDTTRSAGGCNGRWTTTPAWPTRASPAACCRATRRSPSTTARPSTRSSPQASTGTRRAASRRGSKAWIQRSMRQKRERVQSPNG